MVRMAPNSALITAVIAAIEPYVQNDFSVLVLRVKNASKKGSAAFMYNASEETSIRALISNEKRDKANIKAKDSITIEASKVSINLWRITEIVS